MKTTIKTYFAALAILSFTACQKDAINVSPSSGEVEIVDNKKEKLLNFYWILTSETTTDAVGEKMDSYTSLNECIKDNTFQFKEDGILSLDEGATVCDMNARQLTVGSWILSGVERNFLRVKIGNQEIKAEIVELTEEALTWRYANPQNPSETIEQVFVKY